ncbi:MAG: hypothetical protein QOG63_1808 [Thermoleophilaceae bacterium]|nr:hypothetical protein [Thermoleophilaceae bacterium]
MGHRAALVALAITLVVASPARARETVDRPDDHPRADQIHVMYVVPSDGADGGIDQDGTLAGSVASWQAWLRDQTGGHGLVLDTFGGALDVTFVRLDTSEEQVASNGVFARDEIERQLRALGFDAPNKVYAVYYDGVVRANTCGGGAWPPTLPGSVAALYLQGELPPQYPQCNTNPFAGPTDPPGYMEYAMLHEILHTMGFVPECAPHHARSGHTSDSPTDILYAGDEPWTPQSLDVGHDDYFDTGRSDCLDLASSSFLEGNPSRACVATRANVAHDRGRVRRTRAALKAARGRRARTRARKRLAKEQRRIRRDRQMAARLCPPA